ncbi:DUF5667 domain-containing protein [Robertmurraya sp. GLU-23]
MKRKWTAPLVISSMFLFGNSVLAEETADSYDPGTTPDQFIYSMDRLVEDIQLFLASNGSEETDLLLQFAEERIAEAKAMSEEEKQEFVQEAIEDYLKILTDAEETIAEMIINEKMNEEQVLELDEKLEDSTELNEEVGELLDESLLEDVEEKQQVLAKLPSIVNGLDETKVKELRDSGLGYGQIVQVFILANATDKTVEEVGALFNGEDKGFGDVAKELGIHPSELSNGKKKAPKQTVSTIEQEEQINPDVEGTDEEKTETDDVKTEAISDSTEVQLASVAKKENSVQQPSEQQKEETNRLEEEQRKAAEKQKEEANRLEEEQRKAAEKQKEEAKRLAEEQRKAAEKQKEEAKRLAEEQRKASEKQREEAKRQAEQQSKSNEKNKD